MKQGMFQGLMLSIGLAVLGYLGLSLWSGWRGVVSAIQLAGLPILILMLSLSLVNYLLRFVRWHGYLLRLGQQVPWKVDLKIYLAAFALTTTPGKVGEMMRSLWLRPHGVAPRGSLAAFFAERFQDILAMCLLCAFGFSQLAFGQWLVLGALGFCITILAFLAHPNWLQLLRARIGDGNGKIRQALQNLLNLVLDFKRCFSWDATTLGLAIGIMAWGAEAVAFHLLLNALQVPLPLQTSVFIYAFSMLAGGLSFLPGGLGGAEAAMIVLLEVNGIHGATAVAATLIIRLATLWFAVLIGGSLILTGRVQPPKLAEEAAI